MLPYIDGMYSVYYTAGRIARKISRPAQCRTNRHCQIFNMSMIYHVLDASLIMAMAAPGMSSFSIESMVRGHHIYKDRWCPHIDEELTYQRERHSYHDPPRAVSLLKSSVIVEHVPRHISAICYVFLGKHYSSISCKMATLASLSIFENKILTSTYCIKHRLSITTKNLNIFANKFAIAKFANFYTSQKKPSIR